MYNAYRTYILVIHDVYIPTKHSTNNTHIKPNWFLGGDFVQSPPKNQLYYTHQKLLYMYFFSLAQQVLFSISRSLLKRRAASRVVYARTSELTPIKATTTPAPSG